MHEELCVFIWLCKDFFCAFSFVLKSRILFVFVLCFPILSSHGCALFSLLLASFEQIDIPLAGLLANGTQATGSVRLSLLWMHDLPLLLRQVQCRGE